MLSFLKNHPFAVEAFFEESIVLTFSVPKDTLEDLVPECLQLDTLNNKYGFIAVAIVSTKNLRPKGFPCFLGNNFILAGYRIFVRYKSPSGKRLRGLYIIKSETDKKRMEFFGNIFTQYNYTTTDISIKETAKIKILSSEKSGFAIQVNKDASFVPLPSGSPFEDWKEARKFAGPLPFTFTYNNKTKEVLIIEGVRQNWNPEPIEINDYNFDYINTMFPNTAILANAFRINNIPYHWKKGRKEIWK